MEGSCRRSRMNCWCQRLSGWAPWGDVGRLLIYLLWLVNSGVLGVMLVFWTVDVALSISERGKRGQEDAFRITD